MDKKNLIAKANAAKEYVWHELGLDRRSIYFYVFDDGENNKYVESGTVDCAGDIWGDEKFYQIGEKCIDKDVLHCDYVESWVLGDGCPANATDHDVEILEDLLASQPEYAEALLLLFADCIRSVYDFDIENPAA